MIYLYSNVNSNIVAKNPVANKNYIMFLEFKEDNRFLMIILLFFSQFFHVRCHSCTTS